MALIGKNNHESVLREDASLFQVQETKTEKQKWKEMSWKQKLQYFRDYYFFKCLLCCFAAVLVFSFVWNALKPQKEQVLSAAAMTYVAALAVSLAQLLRLMAIAGSRRRDD